VGRASNRGLFSTYALCYAFMIQTKLSLILTRIFLYLYHIVVLLSTDIQPNGQDPVSSTDKPLTIKGVDGR
jgi:hypothetical protein